MDYGQDEIARMGQYRQPLVVSAASTNLRTEKHAKRRESAERDGTMLSMQPSKRISAQVSSGLNRREEVELTHYERPVLDIEKSSRRKGRKGLMAGDISEEYFEDSSHKYQEIASLK